MLVASLSGPLLVSFPAPDSSYDMPACLEAVARTAAAAGVAALRAYSPKQVEQAKRATADLPVVGSLEQPDRRGLLVVTPDLAVARQLAEAGANMILLDASAAAHPVPGLLASLIRSVKEKLGRPVIALVETTAEAERALAYGAAQVAVRGYDALRQVPGAILEAGCETAAQVRGALQAGACAVITSPALLPTEALIQRLLEAARPEPGPLSAERYWAGAAAVIERVQATQGDAIRKAAALCAEAIMKGGVVQVFGAGHSRAFGMELSGRAGGLVPMHVFGLEEVAPPGKRGLGLLDLERGADTAHALLAAFPVEQDDVFIIASNSGRNGCPVELALEVKRRGHKLITVTSLDHSGQVSSRHASGHRVFELADVVIDNGAPFGDAVLTAPGLKESVCAVSSATGALIAQALTAETIRLIQVAGGEPPVYISANVDGSDQHNARLEDRYRGRI